MSSINKQKFLTELGKLLTFMQEEDRETTLAMYSKMFDLVPNEEVLLSMLVSPTRQAVRLARVYDSAFNSEEAAQEGEDDTPPYIECIKEIFNEVLDKIPDADSEESEPQEQKSEEAEKENTSGEEIVPTEEKPSEAVTPEVVSVAEEVVVTEAAVSADAQEEKKEKEEERAKQVDNFLKDFKIENDALSKAKEGESVSAAPEETKEEKPVKEDKKEETTEKESTPVAEPEQKPEAAEKKAESKSDGKLSAGALALFLIIAIPITAIGIILDLAAALGFLSVSAAGFLMTFRILGAAFGSFKVFADVLVVTGTGFVLGAVSFLLLWVAIWLAIHVSVKMVSGVINLAVKLCTKEDGTK